MGSSMAIQMLSSAKLKKNISGAQSECQIGWIDIRSVLNWFQAVIKVCQKVTKAGNFLQFWEGALGPFRLGKFAW